MKSKIGEGELDFLPSSIEGELLAQRILGRMDGIDEDSKLRFR